MYVLMVNAQLDLQVVEKVQASHVETVNVTCNEQPSSFLP